ncbi:hypothetical protein [Blastomonas sp.]|uniref:hypothetical protein n=1 Tax=Blastomonas sp. TaxID=1909299 RepID=UPI0035948A02
MQKSPSERLVQGGRTTADGAAQTELAEVGNRMVEVPASQFSGNGEVLVTGMSRGELKSAGKDALQPEALD